MVYVFAGSNWYGIKTAIDEIVRQFDGNLLAIERLNGSEDEISRLLESVTAVSLFSNKKLIIVDCLSAYKPIADDLNKFLDKIDDSVTLIITEQAIDKRSNYYKCLKKLPNFKEFNELTDQQINKWIVEFIKQHGGTISVADSNYLLGRIGNNQTLLERELVKLLAYNKKITRTDIDLLTDQTPKSKIFDLISASFTGQKERAISIYDDQRLQRVEPQAILGMMVWQMHLVAICSCSSDSMNKLSIDTGLSRFLLDKANTIASRMSRAGVEKFLDILGEIDKLSKSKNYNLDDALKYAIITC